MNIIFTDLFRQECETKLGISRSRVREALAEPDAQDIVRLDGLTLGFFVKREGELTGGVYLLACTRKRDANWFIDLAFRMPRDLVEETGTVEPLVLLQRLVQRFGLTIRIGRQLNKFIYQEAIPVEEGAEDATKLVEVINPCGHSFAQSMYLRIEERKAGRVASVALAYCIDMEEYQAWLCGDEASAREGGVTVEIAPQARGRVTPRDLIASRSGTLDFQGDYCHMGGDEKTGLLFRVCAEAYHLEVGFTSSDFYIERNGRRLNWRLTPPAGGRGHAHCFAMWSPTELRLLVLDETYEQAISGVREREKWTKEIERRTKTLGTEPTIPPNSLLAWARRQAIAPVVVYRSESHFYETVVGSIQSIMDKVSTLGLRNPFWDITYEGSKVVSRRPKRETDIHPTIHSLLFDIAIAKSFVITPEYSVAGGRLDFLISGTLSTGKTVHACVEFKHAHSQELVHGLLKQLPAYMKARASDFGVYCVMYFRGRHFAEPEDSEPTEVQLFLEKQKRATGLQNIRVLIMDFSYQTPPSKL